MSSEGTFVTTGGQVRDPAMDLFQQVANMKGTRTTFAEADAFRKQLGRMIQEGDPRARAVYRGIMEDMDSWGSKLPNTPEAQTLTKAREWHKTNVVPFQEDQPLGKIIAEGAEPAKALNTLLAPGDSHLTALQAFQAQTKGTGQAWDSLRGGAIQRALDSPTALDKMGPITRNTIFTPWEEHLIRNYHDLSATERPVVRKFLSLSESQIPLRVWDLGERGVSDIGTLKRTLGEGSPAWSTVQQDLLHRVVGDTRMLNRMSPTWSRAVFTGDQAAFLDELQAYYKASQTRQRVDATTAARATGTTVPMVVQLSSVGAAMGQAIHALITGNPAGAAYGLASAGAVTLGPAMIAKAMASPRLVKLMTEGLKERAGTVRGMQIAAQIKQELKSQGSNE